MQTWVSINGLITPAEEARISVFDRGFLFGDSVYEVLRTANGRPLFWPEHAARLWESAGRIALDPQIDPEVLRGWLQAVLDKIPGESTIRIIVSRGAGKAGLALTDAGEPTRVIVCSPLSLPPAHLYTQGCALKIVRTPQRNNGDLGSDPRAKSGSRLLAVMALAEAEKAGYYEALRVDPSDRVLEGGTSTIFIVRQGVVITPPLHVGILAGITRKHVLELAAGLGLEAREDEIAVGDLAHADEAFITSAVRGVMPVARIDDQHFEAPGPTTAKLLAAYRAMLAAN
jgi:branched-chain amino acid aminotransferase